MTKFVSLVFLLPVLFFSVVYCICTDKNALYAVNATVHSSKYERAGKITGNFYELENYTMIDVFQANVTDLCEGMIKKFPILESLSLINVNLSRIQPDAFQNVNRLRELSLAVNHLTEIVRGAFNNLPALETLYLSSNDIERIEENAFSNIPRLKAVHLDWNKIVYVYGNTFAGSPRMSLVDFRFNQIQKIGKESFQDIKPKGRQPIKIYLNKNSIREIDPYAFDLPNPLILHLEGNRLSSLDILSNIFFNVRQSSKLFLNDNDFECIPEDVVIGMRDAQMDLYIRNNPLRCDCLDRIDHQLGEEFHGNGQFNYSSKFDCAFVNAIGHSQ